MERSNLPELNGSDNGQEKSFTCFLCGTNIPFMQAVAHYEEAHSKIKCKYCPQDFINAESLRQHERSIHPEMKRSNLRKRSGSDNGQEKSSHCGKICSSKQGLENHEKAHSKIQCENSPQELIDTEALRHHERSFHQSEKDRPYECLYCEKNFVNKSQLKIHENSHTRETVFPCDICSHVFTDHSNLRQHRLIHSGFKAFKCQLCGKCFYTAYYLRKHQKTHSNKKSFQCELCQLRFAKARHLKRHKLIHSAESHSNVISVTIVLDVDKL